MTDPSYYCGAPGDGWSDPERQPRTDQEQAEREAEGAGEGAEAQQIMYDELARAADTFRDFASVLNAIGKDTMAAAAGIAERHIRDCLASLASIAPVPVCPTCDGKGWVSPDDARRDLVASRELFNLGYDAGLSAAEAMDRQDTP